MKMSKTMPACLALWCTLWLAGTARAGSLTVNAEDGVLQITSGVSEYTTYGDTMDGMTVRATFLDNTTEQAVWADTGLEAGAAAGTGWSLGVSGNTYDAHWALDNDSGQGIRLLSLDGGPGDTLFDRDYDPFPGTPDSADGRDFTVVSGGDPLDIVATYSDAVQVDANPPVRDIYRRLRLSFTNSGGMASGTELVFQQDTDETALEGDIRPLEGEIPEPATFLAALAGLGGLGGYLRRRGR